MPTAVNYAMFDDLFNNLKGFIYEEAQLWLLEDEYEPIEGRVSASEFE